MSTISTITFAEPAATPSVYRMNVDEYERLVAAGVLDDPRIELIDGLLVRKMGKNPPHVTSAKWLLRILERLVPPGWHVSKEDPVRIPDFNEPEPDLAVVAGEPEDYRGRHPGPADIALLIEVSESTLDRDQGKKRTVYAAGGIAVYWIVNLVDNQVEVYTDPGPDDYRSCQVFRPGQDIPVTIDGVERGRLAVTDVLP